MDSKSIKGILRDLNARLDSVAPRFLSAIQIQEEPQRKHALDACNDRVVSEAQSLLCSFLDELCKNALASDIFCSPKQKNTFYSRNLSSEIISKYNFTVTPCNLELPKDSSLATFLPAVGVLGIGTALSFSLHTPIILPVAFVFALMTYFIAKSVLSQCNKHKSQELINKHIDELKEQILVWLRNVEEYFNSQIASIAKGGI